VQSVFKNQDAALELIVIDDGSFDGTGEMIQKEFPEIKYSSFPNQGPSAARNRGIEKAQGDWVAFLDSDDEWMEGKLQAQLDFFRHHPNTLICQTEEIWFRNGRRVNPMKKHKKYGGWIFNECLPLCIISPSAVMVHRKLLDDVGLFDESLPACEDYDLWLRMAAKYPVGLIEKPFVIRYGGHPDQRSHEFPAMDLFRIQSLAKILASEILNEEQKKSARKMLEHKSAIYISGALKRGKHEDAKKIQELISEALQTR